MRVRDRSPIPAAITIVLILISGSVLVSACADDGSDQNSQMPTDVAEIDLAGLDVEMHYAVG